LSSVFLLSKPLSSCSKIWSDRGSLTHWLTRPEAMVEVTKPVSNAQFVIFLNALLIDNLIEVDENRVIDPETKTLLMDLNNSDIEYIDDKFVVDKQENEKSKITGITYVIVEKFIEWISKYHKIKYLLSAVDGNWTIDMSSFKYPLYNEFVYNYYSSKYTNIDYYVAKKKGSSITIDKDDGNYPISKDFLSNEVSFRMMKKKEDNAK